MGVGGVESYIRNFGNFLINKNDKVFLHYWSNLSLFVSDKFKCKSVAMFSFKIPILRHLFNLFLHNYSLSSYIYLIKPDILIFNTLDSLIYSLPIIYFFRLKRFFVKNKQLRIICQFHGSVAIERKQIQHFSKIKKQLIYLFVIKLEKLSLELMDKVIAFSEYSGNDLLSDTIGLKRNKVLIVSPGKTLSNDLAISKTQAKSMLGLNSKKPVLLFIGRVEPRKGSEKIIEIYRKLIIDYKIDCNLLFCSNYTQLAYEVSSFFSDYEKNGFGAKVFFVQSSNQSDLKVLYRAADLFLMPSVNYETFGFSTLESLSFGTPVAAFKIGANKELIQHGKNGFLYPLSKVDQMCKGIYNYVNSNYKERKMMSIASKKSSEKFNWRSYYLFLLDI